MQIDNFRNHWITSNEYAALQHIKMKVNFYIPLQEASNLVFGFGSFFFKKTAIFIAYLFYWGQCLQGNILYGISKRSCCVTRQIGFGCTPCMSQVIRECIWYCFYCIFLKFQFSYYWFYMSYHTDFVASPVIQNI